MGLFCDNIKLSELENINTLFHYSNFHDLRLKKKYFRFVSKVKKTVNP